MKSSPKIAAALLTISTVLAGALALGLEAAHAAPPESALAGWPRQLGTAGAETPAAVAVSRAGDVYVVGSTTGAFADPSAGNSDGWLARFDKTGRLKWVRQFGASGTDFANGVAVSGNSVYVAGSLNGALSGTTDLGGDDAFVARYDVNGNQKWLRRFGTNTSDEVLGVAAVGNNVVVAGDTAGSLGGGPVSGPGDAFLARFDGNGNQKWVRQFGTDQSDLAIGVAASATSIAVTGATYGSFTGSTNAGNRDVFVARFDTAGNRKWLRQTGTTTFDTSNGVAIAGTNIYIGGTTSGTFPGATSQGNNDGFVARYDGNGNAVWIQQFGTSGNDFANGITAAGSAVYITGFAGGSFPGFPLQGPSDAYVARYADAGSQTWVRQFGTPDSDGAYGVALRSSDANGGGVVVAGFTNGASWGQVNAGSSDAFVATFLK